MATNEEIDRILDESLNFYEVLRVDPESDNFNSDLRRNFKQLAPLVHSDRNRENVERADEACKVLLKAYQTLKDPTSRLERKHIIYKSLISF